MAVNSRAKGKRGELEAAAKLRELFGWTASRAAQHKATENSADLNVEETPALWWEVKRVERLCLPKTMAEAASACGRKCPCIMHRRNGDPDWLLTIRLSDLPQLVHAYDASCQIQSGETVAAKKVSSQYAGAGQGNP